MSEEHNVPLAPAALELLNTAKGLFPSKPDSYVFRGTKRQPLSDMTLGKVLKDNGGTGFTVRGFAVASKTGVPRLA